MCVIIYTPKGTELPSENTFRAAWSQNPDGGGLFWIENGKVHISKGYFDFDEFYRDILAIKDKDYEMAAHMRIATAGGISKRMCHPFPLTNKKEDIFSLSGSYDSAIMHNGIIHINNRADYSDTAEFVVTNLYSRYQTDKRFYNNLTKKSQLKLENQIGGSRMIFFGGDGSVKMIGNWTKREDGCYYSNTHFEWREKDSYKSYYPQRRTYSEYFYDKYGYNWLDD